MFFHSVCGIVQHQRLQGVKFVWGGKTVASPRISEYGDTLELASVTGGRENMNEWVCPYVHNVYGVNEWVWSWVSSCE